ncbi:hypothetical protein ACLB2K_042881 [Fragaria x ananassa]
MDQQQQQRVGAPQYRPPPPGQGGGGESSSVLFVLVGFLAVFFMLVLPSVSTISNSFSILHQVPEGHVGVYWRGGALLKTITDPGFHLKLPLITQYEPVQVTLQTDQVKDIPCGTKGGVMINFEKIEVVNRLRKEYVYETLLNYGVHYDNTWIYDKIHHEINQFCSSNSLQDVYIDVFDQIDEKMKDALQVDCTKYAPGIEIINVRVTKPKIPDSIRRNFEQMEEERTKVLIAIERQRVVEKEAETRKKMAISEAEKNANVSKILMEQKLMEKDSSRRQEEIENAMYLAREKSLADADFYKVMREAEANKLKLTPQFLELKFIEAIADNTKIFFGDKVPNMVLDQRLLGNFLKVSREVPKDVSKELTEEANNGETGNPEDLSGVPLLIPLPSEWKFLSEVKDVCGGKQRRCRSMHAAGLDLIGDMACCPDYARKKRPASSAYLSGLLYHQFLGCCSDCFDIWIIFPVLFAMVGGIVLSLGNLSTQYAWALVGLSVTEVITASITTIIGTTLNYFLDDRINRAEILFPGVACFLIAVCLGSAVHSSNAADNKVKLDSVDSDPKDVEKASKQIPNKDGLKELESANEKAKAGTADFLVQLQDQRAIKVFGKSTFVGLAICFFAGLCFSLFSPAFNVATNDQWHTLKKGVPHLVVYTVFFYFSLSCFVLAIILNIIFLYRPILGLPKTTFKAYLNDWNGRGWALLAGVLCGFGNGLQFMGGQAAGYAAADSVQALPLVNTFWGIRLFGENRKSSGRTYVLLTGMLTMFIVAVADLEGVKDVPLLVFWPSEWNFSRVLKMYVVESKGGAIACMLLALFFLGTWPAVLAVLERRGRLPQHTYLDYSITNFLAAVLIALTFGQIGSSTAEEPNFITQLSQFLENWPCVLFAMAGGIFLSLGNLSSQYAFALVGLSVTEVITASITVVIGTTLNYFLDDKINSADILFPGVACFLIAVCLGSAVHSSNAADNKVKLDHLPSVPEDGEKPSSVIPDMVCFSLFSPALNLATNDQWNTLKKGVPDLVVYTAFFYFSASCLVIAIILNITFLYHPILGLPKSSFKAYLSDWDGRGLAFLAGIICGFGNGLQFMGGQAAGYAAADAVQALPLVSTFWGILLFGEYRKSSRRTYALLISIWLKMYVVESKGGAIACMLIALTFLGTWPAVLTMLERRGRLPQHTYLDYSITNLLVAVLIAFTFGQIGSSTHEMPNFLTQLSQNNWPSVLFAMAGGIVLSLGNLATQYAWALVGLSVTEVITSSITVVIGTTLNYFLDDRINRAEILFPGVACFLIAVCLGSAVHSSNAADNKVKLDSLPSDKKEGEQASTVIPIENLPKDMENGNVSAEKAKAGTANFLVQLENRRAIKVFGKNTFIGLAITFFAGFCFSLFVPAFNVATNDQWHTLEKGVPHLVVYTAFFYFSASCFVIAIILNIIFLYRPILGLPKTTFKAYLNDWNGRGWALLAGVLCGFGNGLQFMGGQAAGYAAADSVQALPLVSTFWGILLFGEYRKSSRRTYVLLISMLFMFIAAVGILMASSGHRK